MSSKRERCLEEHAAHTTDVEGVRKAGPILCVWFV